MNSQSEVELNVKRIIENLKHVKPPTIDISYYHNGTPSEKVPTLSAAMGLDKSEQAQHKADQQPDVSGDKD